MSCCKYIYFYVITKTLSGSGAVVGDDLPGHTVIGCNNIIGHHAVVGIKCQDMKYKVTCFLQVLFHNEIYAATV